MKNIFFLIFLCSLFIYSCEEPSNTTVNGYNLEWLNKGGGQKAAAGDMATAHLYFYMDGKMQTSTRQAGSAVPIKINSDEELLKMKESGQPNPIYDAVTKMSVGDSVKVAVPITEEMRKDARMKDVKEVFYHIVLESTKSEEDYKAEIAAKQAEEAELSKATLARAGEIETLAKDIAKQYSEGRLDDKIKTTESGLKYMVMEDGTGKPTQVGREIKVQYYGMLTNGERFDDSFSRGSPIAFPLGQGRVIKGWDEGLALMKGGDRGVLFIPSELGYGKRGSGAKIPPDSELIFYVEIL